MTGRWVWEICIEYTCGLKVYGRGKNKSGEDYLFVSLYQRILNSRSGKSSWSPIFKKFMIEPAVFPPKSTKSWEYEAEGEIPEDLTSLVVKEVRFYPV